MSSTDRKLKKCQTFGRKRHAVAVASCVPGVGIVRVNGRPLELIEPAELRVKAFEPLLLLGPERYNQVNIRIRVRGGGTVAQMYAVRQAIAKSIVSYYQKNVDEASKQILRDQLVGYDRSLLVSDPRRCEPKKFGGSGARARRQKSYR